MGGYPKNGWFIQENPVWARIPTRGQTVTADHSRMGSAMMLSLHCSSPPGVRSSLFVKVDECFYALVVGSVAPCGESAAFPCLGVMNDKVVKQHCGVRALSTCPSPSRETAILEGPVVAMGASWFKEDVVHIQPQLFVDFSWADADLPHLSEPTSVSSMGVPARASGQVCAIHLSAGLASRFDAELGRTWQNSSRDLSAWMGIVLVAEDSMEQQWNQISC